jgi:predicted transcriptional regulator
METKNEDGWGESSVREAFGVEAMRAWAEYLESGLHLTGKEVRVWLEGWGTEGETDLPPCHG